MKFLERYRDWSVFSAYLVLITVSNFLAFSLRFEFSIPASYYPVIGTTLPLILVVRFLVFYFYDVHRGSWRHSSIGDMLSLVKAISVSTVLLGVIVHYLFGIDKYPRSIYFIDGLVLMAFIGAIRLRWRISREFRLLSENGGKRVLFIGAGDAGEMILREIRQNPKLSYCPVGFIDDDLKKRKIKIHGVPVLGTRKELPSIAKRYEAEEIIITISSATAQQTREVVEDCKKTGLPVKIIPGIGNMLNGHVSALQIRDVKLEDLLYRDVIQIDTQNVAAYLKGRTVLVTGAAGSIGLELCRQVARCFPKTVVLFDQAESDLYFAELELREKYPEVSFVPVVGDILDVRLVRQVMGRWQPHLLFHSAAYKHVPLMEQNPSEAVRNNIIATRNLALAAEDFFVEKFVLISTDKAVNPSSVMGVTKRVAELFIKQMSRASQKTCFVTVRFGNVLGSNGSVVPLFKAQIEKGGPVTITHAEIKRYFMLISEAVHLVLQATHMGRGGEIFVLDMGEQIKILDLAKHMIHLAGMEIDRDIKIEFTGLRPGEKLYEELFDSSETIETTEHKKIMKAIHGSSAGGGLLNQQMKELEAALYDDKAVLEKLNDIVPSSVVLIHTGSIHSRPS